MRTEQADMNELVSVLRRLTEYKFPGCTGDFEAMEYDDDQDGFGLSTGSGLAMVMANCGAAPRTGAWGVQFSSCVAIDVPLFDVVAGWINEANRGAAAGKYYYVPTSDHSQSAVIWEEMIPSRVLVSGFLEPGGQSVLNWVSQVMGFLIETSTELSKEFINEHGGRPLMPNQDDMMQLFVAASAG